jgi:glycosyltransferase involved in cell wall biosynthesis
MIPISVCIITKNQEENLEKCLAPLVPYDFEIIVVDTGSTDGTKEVALKYTDKVYDFEWCDDFSAARNFSLKKASHNYVLVLDSDEFLTGIDLEAIYQAIDEHPKAVGLLLRNNYFPANGELTNSPDRVERLFHKRYYHYEYSIHEQVTSTETGCTDYERYDIPLEVDHVGYCTSADAKKKKAEMYNALLFKEIEKNPDEPYFYFQVGQSYNFIDDYENACIYYKKAFELPLIIDQLWVQMMAPTYIIAMIQTGRVKEAIMFFERCYDDFATCADFYTNMGVAYLTDQQPLKAMMEFIKATQCPVVHTEGSNTYIPWYNMGLINERLGRMDDAVSFYRKAGSYPLAVESLRRLGIQP